MSRRKLFAAAPIAAAAIPLGIPLTTSQRAPNVVDVRSFGATGDGSTDDSRAIQAAVAALTPHSVLRFPAGSYRFTERRPAGGAAIALNGLSDVAVEFTPGAELLMDNLDPATGTGTSHGVLVEGPASRIALCNIAVRWATTGPRSLGDGIRVQGCPDLGPVAGWTGRPTPVQGISLTDCSVQRSPQTGVVMLGACDITVTGLSVMNTGADGLHFNGCRNATITGHTAIDPGDDGLALVTYFAPEVSFTDEGTFAFPTLTDWCNADFAITDVEVIGGRANGVRIAGAQRVHLAGLRASGVRTGAAVMVDSAEPGADDVAWNYLASRGVRLRDVTAAGCETGVHLLARPGSAGDRRFVDYDVGIDVVRLENCDNWAVRAESLSGPGFSGLLIDDCQVSAASTSGGNGGVGISNGHGISLGDVSIRHALPVLAFAVDRATQLRVARLEVFIDTGDQNIPAATPCVALDDSDGVINAIELAWSGAPSSWTALRMSAPKDRDPVTIGSVTLHTPTGAAGVSG